MLLTLLITIFQLEKAKDYREQSEAKQEYSLDIIEKLTYDIPEQLIEIPETMPVINTILDHNIWRITEIIELCDDKEQGIQLKASNYENMGKIYKLIGESEKSKDNYFAASAIRYSLYKHNNTNDESILNFANSCINLADAYLYFGEDEPLACDVRAKSFTEVNKK